VIEPMSAPGLPVRPSTSDLKVGSLAWCRKAPALSKTGAPDTFEPIYQQNSPRRTAAGLVR
jgi:hypothetical protein